MILHWFGKFLDNQGVDVTEKAHLFLGQKITLDNKVVLHDLMGVIVKNKVIQDALGGLPEELCDFWKKTKRIPSPQVHPYHGDLYVNFMEVNRSASFNPGKKLIVLNKPVIYGFSQYYGDNKYPDQSDVMLDLKSTSLKEMLEVEILLNPKVRLFMPENFNPVILQVSEFTLFEVLVAVRDFLLMHSFTKKILMGELNQSSEDNIQYNELLDQLKLLKMSGDIDDDMESDLKKQLNLLRVSRKKENLKDVSKCLSGVYCNGLKVHRMFLFKLISIIPNNVDLCLFLSYIFQGEVRVKEEAMGLSAKEYRQNYFVGFDSEDIDLGLNEQKKDYSEMMFETYMLNLYKDMSKESFEKFLI